MASRPWIASLCLVVLSLACGQSLPPAATAPPTAEHLVFDSGRTAYGFFPSPPEMTTQSMLTTLKVMGEHSDLALIQRDIPWKDFLDSSDGPSQDMTDLINLVIAAGQAGLEPVFVIDPLNGLDRRQFAPLPAQLAGADFSTPALRQAFTNYAVRLAKVFHPRYLGLASEINTYADAHLEDFAAFVSLYHQTYAAIKRESPATQVFVTFQWEDLNNLGWFNEGRTPYQINWESVEAFDPELDVWAISSYRFVAFDHASRIPADYYTPLLERTPKPLAVAEGGWNSTDITPFHGSPEDQVGYLQAIDAQLGRRLKFWIYLIIQDFNLESYRPVLESQGMESSVSTLGLFEAVGLRAYDGTPKPGLATWDGIRGAP
jgi:hypothetical protein